MASAEGTVSFSHGSLKIRDDAVGQYLVETLCIVLREQVNAYALTLLDKMLPPIDIRRSAIDYVRAVTKERLVDWLIPGRLGYGKILTNTAKQLLQQDSGCSLLAFMSILYSAGGPGMMAMQMRRVIVEEQPAARHRLSWEDLLPTVEALVLPGYVTEMRQHLVELVKRIATVFPRAAAQHNEPNDAYDRMCHALLAIKEARSGTAVHLRLDYGTAILVALLSENLAHKECVFVEGDIDNATLLTSPDTVYMSLDSDAYYVAAALKRQFNEKMAPYGIDRYFNGPVKIPFEHFERALLSGLSHRGLERKDLRALVFVAQLILTKRGTTFGHFLLRTLSEILEALSPRPNGVEDRDSLTQACGIVASLSRPSSEAARKQRTELLADLAMLPLQDIDDCTSEALSMRYRRSLSLSISKDPGTDDSSEETEHPSAIYAFVAVGLASKFIDLQNVGVSAAASAWSSVGIKCCLTCSEQAPSAVEDSVNIIFGAVIGEEISTSVHPVLAKHGVVLSSSIIFDKCEVGKAIYRASLGQCIWLGESVTEIRGEKAPGGTEVDDYTVDRSLMPFDADPGGGHLELVTRFDERVDMITLSGSVIGSVDSEVPLRGILPHYANAFLLAEIDGDTRRPSTVEANNWRGVRCATQLSSDFSGEELLVYATLRNQRARQTAFLAAMEGGPTVIQEEEVPFDVARCRANGVRATSLIL